MNDNANRKGYGVFLIFGFIWFLVLLSFCAYQGCFRAVNTRGKGIAKEAVTLMTPFDDSLGFLVKGRIAFVTSRIREDTVNWFQHEGSESWNHPLKRVDSTCGYPRMVYFATSYTWLPERWIAYESRHYLSGRAIAMISSDRGFQARESDCESLVIDYDWVTSSYECILSTALPQHEPMLDHLDQFYLTLPQADSVLATWGLTRQWPIEEWEEEYRNGQK
jgi:hypothetical protein